MTAGAKACALSTSIATAGLICLCRITCNTGRRKAWSRSSMSAVNACRTTRRHWAFRERRIALYRNQGDGTFRDVTDEAGLAGHAGKGMGLACVDYDGDGQVDVFVANDTMENFLFHNVGQGRFEEVAHLAGVAYNTAGVPEASMGVDAADYDHDGDWDFIVPCLSGSSLHSTATTARSSPTSHPSSDSPRRRRRATGFDAHFLDYDNDGDLDLFFTCGGVRMNENAPADATYNQRYGMPDLLLANDGTGHYVDVSHDAGPYFQQVADRTRVGGCRSGQRWRSGPGRLQPE